MMYLNKKAEEFQAYLAERQITCYKVDEIADDELNTVVFRSRIEVAGQSLPLIIILDSTLYGIIRVKIADKVLTEQNKVSLFGYINGLNRKYKVFKYYFVEDGSIFLDSQLMSSRAEGEKIYLVLELLLKQLNKEYSGIMKSIWS